MRQQHVERIAQPTQATRVPPSKASTQAAIQKCALWLAKATTRQLLTRENQVMRGLPVDGATTLAAVATGDPTIGGSATPPASLQELAERANHAIAENAAAQEVAQQQV